MTLRATCLLALLLAPSAHAEKAGPPTSFADVVNVEIVNVEVTVSDRDGHPVTGLRAADFELLENGKPVPISNFSAIEGRRRTLEERISVEGGAPEVEVSTEPAAQAPSGIVVYVDNTNLSPFNRNRLLGYVSDFLKTRLAAGDRAMLVTFNGSVEVKRPFSSDWKALEEGFREIAEMPISDQGPYARSRQLVERIVQMQQMYEEGGRHELCSTILTEMIKTDAQATYNEVQSALEAIGTVTDSLAGVPGRKHMLHVSDGIPLNPGQDAFELFNQMCGGGGVREGVPLSYDPLDLEPAERMNAEFSALDATRFSALGLFKRLTERANASGVTFYTLDASGHGTTAAGDASVGDRRQTYQSVDRVRRANLQDSLMLIASETGGRAILNTTDFAPVLAEIGQELDTYYSLGYRLAGEPGGGARTLAVKVKRDGVTVRYRKSFEAKSASEQVADRTLGTLLFGIEDNPLGITLEVGEPVALDGSLFSVPIRVKIPIGKLTLLPQDGKHVGKLSLQVGARDRDGRLAPVRRIEIPLAIPDAQIAVARTKLYLYEVKMLMRAGDHAVAVGLSDELGQVASYTQLSVPVAASPAP